MRLTEIQKFCKNLLSRVQYPRVGTIIGLQEEIGKLSEAVMDLEIYGKPFDREKLEKKCAEVFFSLIDLCNSYDVQLDKASEKGIEELKRKINKWERQHGEVLQDKRMKLN